MHFLVLAISFFGLDMSFESFASHDQFWLLKSKAYFDEQFLLMEVHGFTYIIQQ